MMYSYAVDDAFCLFSESYILIWWRFVLVLTCWGCLFATTSQAGERYENSTGSLEFRLQRTISATWQGQELEVALERIAATGQVALWLDRRVDPHQEVTLQLKGVTIEQALRTLSERHGLSITRLGEMIYVGPQKSVAELPTLAQQLVEALDSASSETNQRWKEPQPSSWPHLTEPRKLLERWLQKAGITLLNPTAIPHDLWSAQQLPAMSLADRVVLLCVGFNLACEPSSDGLSCQLKPIERPLPLKRNYTLNKRQQQVAAQLLDEIPNDRIVRQGHSLAITGSWDVHQRLSELLKEHATNEKTRSHKSSQQIYSLRLKNQPVGPVIDQLASQLGLEVTWDKELLFQQPDIRTKRTTCQVENVPLSELLLAVLRPVELEFRLEENHLTIVSSRSR